MGGPVAAASQRVNARRPSIAFAFENAIASAEHLPALAARAGLPLLQARAVGAVRVHHVAFFLVRSAEDEPGLTVGRVDRDGAFARFDRIRDLAVLERGARFVELFLRVTGDDGRLD